MLDTLLRLILDHAWCYLPCYERASSYRRGTESSSEFSCGMPSSTAAAATRVVPDYLAR